MLDDRVGTLRKRLGVGLDFLGESTLESLGRKLNRSQWVFDFVRDTAGNSGPGGLALRRLQFGDVVERHHEAVGAAGG